MQNVSSKFPGVGNPASPEMVGLGDPDAMTRLRPGAHGGAGRGAQNLLGGAGRGAQVCAPVRPCCDGGVILKIGCFNMLTRMCIRQPATLLRRRSRTSCHEPFIINSRKENRKKILKHLRRRNVILDVH